MSISNIKLSQEIPFLIIARVKVKEGKQKRIHRTWKGNRQSY